MLDEARHHPFRRVVLCAVHDESIPPNELSVSYEEDFQAGLVVLRRHADGVQVVAGNRSRLDLLLLRYPLNSASLVPKHRGPLELQCVGGLMHLLLQVRQHRLRLPFHEQDHLVDYLVVILLVYLTRAGGGAPVDEEFQAGALVFARDDLGAGAIGKELLEQRQRLANAVGRGEGAEINCAVVFHPAGDVYLGKLLRPVYLDVRVGLVVLEAGVELRPVLLDEGVLQDEGLSRRVGDDVIVVGYAGQHPANLRLVVGRGCEVGAKPGPQVRRLAHVQHLPLVVLHLVDAGADGRDTKPVSQGRDGHGAALVQEDA